MVGRHRADAAGVRLAHAGHHASRYARARPARRRIGKRPSFPAVSRGAGATVGLVDLGVQLHADGDRRVRRPRRNEAGEYGGCRACRLGSTARGARRRSRRARGRAREADLRVAVAASTRRHGRAGELSRRVGIAGRLADGRSLLRATDDGDARRCRERREPISRSEQCRRRRLSARELVAGCVVVRRHAGTARRCEARAVPGTASVCRARPAAAP